MISVSRVVIHWHGMDSRHCTDIVVILGIKSDCDLYMTTSIGRVPQRRVPWIKGITEVECH